MSKSKLIPALAILLLSAMSALAHHGFTMFDMEKNITLTGTVEAYDWFNPHTHITVKVENGADKSLLGTWDVEGAAPSIMARQGWNKATYKPGDAVTIVVHPLKNGDKGASLFYAIRPDGSRLYQDIARPKDDPGKD